MQITRPFEIINQATEYDVRCSVKGGGPTGQAGAMVHGISKALVMFDENFKTAKFIYNKIPNYIKLNNKYI